MTEKTILPPAKNTPLPAVSEAAQSARRAAAQWKRYSLSERVSIVRQVWKEILSREESLLQVIHEETGKPLAEIKATEICALELIVSYFTSSAHRILQDQAAWRPWFFFNKRAYVRYVPRGVIGLIAPWNLPLLIPLGDAVAAWLAGNAVLLKPSEWTSRTALWLEQAIKSSGLMPEGLLSVVTGSAEVGQQVIHESDLVLFTGSPHNGKLVAELCARELKPVVLELGGKHPMIVLKDAALSRAVKAAVWGAFANSGQMCVGVKRIFVEAEIYEQFTEAVRHEISLLRLSSDGGEADLGRLIFPPQLEKIQSLLEDARAKGGKVIGGQVQDGSGFLMKPALVLDARPEMRVMSEESFGPVLPIMKVGSAEEALTLANQSPLGLAASVWSQDLGKAERLGANLEAGLLGINELLTHYAVPSLPFGGIKASGLGRRHSDEGLRQFCWTQSVIVHEWPAKIVDLWYFPYQPWKTRIISWLTRRL